MFHACNGTNSYPITDEYGSDDTLSLLSVRMAVSINVLQTTFPSDDRVIGIFSLVLLSSQPNKRIVPRKTRDESAFTQRNYCFLLMMRKVLLNGLQYEHFPRYTMPFHRIRK